MSSNKKKDETDTRIDNYLFVISKNLNLLQTEANEYKKKNKKLRKELKNKDVIINDLKEKLNNCKDNDKYYKKYLKMKKIIQSDED